MISISDCSDFKLDDAWRMHRKAKGLLGLPGPSRHMLFFYAVECGLKHLLVHKRNSPKCPKSEKDSIYKHNLDKILRELEPSAAEIPPVPSNLHLRLRTKSLQHPNFNDVHLAWRYGLTIEPTNEKEILAWLQAVDRFIAVRRRK